MLQSIKSKFIDLWNSNDNCEANAVSIGRQQGQFVNFQITTRPR